MTDCPIELEKAKVNLETSQIPWLDLQRFFAAGLAIAVDDSLDLVEVAYQFSIDNKSLVEDWLNKQQLAPVSDRQAEKWFNNKIDVWAVVVKPWILVQEPATNKT
ncbi:hypothetical protein A1359_17425 [Methylomonas lenta]|uniref:DUF2288 domain-containing protein n=1 Tax=Methylomonas lenta TaxID=980561 RepID=A0A177MYE0_9GAMM|nr:DUF2288 domain-containing protein [Methylomonas lenta]OAI09990.1 hypothetical protein A1359_17425 [Methylomonas lenta]